MAAKRFRSHARSGFQGGGRRALTDWNRIVTPMAVILPAAKLVMANITLSNPGIGETIRRTRGRISVNSDQPSSPEEQNCALGFIVVTDLAATVGATSIPGPITEASDDGWYVWEGFVQRSLEAFGGNLGMTYEFDSKAMRKVEDGFQVVVIAENGGVAGLQIGLSISTLTSLS